jgi:hypothetical protein
VICAKCHRPIRNAVLIAGAVYGSKCAGRVRLAAESAATDWHRIQPNTFAGDGPYITLIEPPSLWQRFKARAAEILSAWRDPFNWEVR